LGLLLLGTGTRLAQAGFVVHGMDYEGHGKSSGLQGYINSFDDIVVDCSKYFASVCGMIYK
jgi:alpha-beta hydrolase superfamily lysophospholipase